MKGSARLLDGRGMREVSEEAWRGGFLFPGVWDFHVHGGGGYSLASSRDEEIRRALRAQFFHGTSALVATLPAMSRRTLEEALGALDGVKRTPRPGEARVLGAYLEGPFINPQKVGGMDAGALEGWTVETFLSLVDRFPGLVRVVTLAPERPEAQEVIPALVERGVVVSVGHTQAGEEETLRAIALGARLVTHLFNAMGPFHHRAPGGALACLLDHRVKAEFIPEEGHLHPLVQRFIVRLKGPGGLIPVSDGTPLAAGGPREMEWMGTRVTRKGGAVVRRDGRIFGSAISLLEGLRFLDDSDIWPLGESIPALLRNVACLLGEEPPMVEEGYRGPLYLLTEKGDLEIVE